jgi:serine/threonine protein phosphatase PrpC
MQTVSVLKAAGDTDPGLQREVNEDRFHFDVARRLFMVIDGVGGQAAGGKAADTAVSILRSRLERETGPVVERLREAITVANNEVHRVAGLRPEWNGMACVLTVVVVDDARAIVGHVGDTRLYKVRHDRIEKVTRDHSPVGEREDAHELSELEAMRHPRRNEVYRDVGSEPHGAGDPDFMDVKEIPFEPDAALLLCSDGLTDLIDSGAIHQIVRRWSGQPHQVVRALIDAANDAGGKDNVTVVYVEGEQFAETGESAAEITRRLSTAPSELPDPAPADRAALDAAPGRATKRQQAVRWALLGLLSVVIVLALARSYPVLPEPVEQTAAVTDAGRIVVEPSQSIALALQSALPGTTIVVEPGEYRETLRLKSHVRLVSQVRLGAVIRLPGNASEADAAIVAHDVTDAALDGFRVIGDAATPLGTGVSVTNSELSISGVEITGAARAAIDADATSHVSLIGSDIRDNPGTGLALRTGANAAISHNVFMRNGTAGAPQLALLIEANSAPTFTANVFFGISPDLFDGSGDTRVTLVRDNWFVDARSLRVIRPRPGSR